MKRKFFKILKWTRRGLYAFKKVRTKLAVSMGLSTTLLLGYTSPVGAVVSEILTPKVNDIVSEVQLATNILGVLAVAYAGFLVFFSQSKKATTVAAGLIIGYLIIFGSVQIWAWIQS